jgi:hypothetical protein
MEQILTSTQSKQAQTRFELGDLCYTPGAQALLNEYRISPFQLLARHVTGDWGDICKEDTQTNEEALELGGRLMSVCVLTPPNEDHATKASAKVWVITESDRSVTTLLLPEEY